MNRIQQARELINQWLNQAGQSVSNLIPSSTHSFRKPRFESVGSVQAAEPSTTPNPMFNTGEFRFAYETLPRDEYYATNGPRPNFNPPQPPSDIANLIRELFPDEATAAALIAATENSQFNPRRPDAINYDASGNEISRDRGLFQINNNTFTTEMGKFGDKLKDQGINSYEDMYDPEKNIKFAKHIKDSYGAKRWFGWQDTGFDLNKGWFSAPLRGTYAENKKTMSPKDALSKAREDLKILKKGKK